jgi:hypothetical protein
VGFSAADRYIMILIDPLFYWKGMGGRKEEGGWRECGRGHIHDVDTRETDFSV